MILFPLLLTEPGPHSAEASEGLWVREPLIRCPRIDSMSSPGLRGVATLLFQCYAFRGAVPTSSENACRRAEPGRACARACACGAVCVRYVLHLAGIAGVACRQHGSGQFLSSFVKRRTRGHTRRAPNGETGPRASRRGFVKPQHVRSIGPNSCCLGRQRGARPAHRGAQGPGSANPMARRSEAPRPAYIPPAKVEFQPVRCLLTWPPQ